MDKQELISVFKTNIAEEEQDKEGRQLPTDSWLNGYENGRIDALEFGYKLAKWLDEPEITTEQAWEKIAEKFEEGPKELCATLVSALPPYNLSEKPEIPQFVAKEIPSAPKEALDCYYNPGVYIVPPYSYKVINWIEGHFDIFLQALVNGFEIQKEPVWVVKTFAGYLTKFETFVNNNWRATTSSSKDDKDIITFECKEKANEIATLVDGTVKEWSE